MMIFQGNVGEQIFHHIIRKRFYGVLFSEGCVQLWKNSRRGDMSFEAATFTKMLAPSCFNLIFLMVSFQHPCSVNTVFFLCTKSQKSNLDLSSMASTPQLMSCILHLIPISC